MLTRRAQDAQEASLLCGRQARSSREGRAGEPRPVLTAAAQTEIEPAQRSARCGCLTAGPSPHQLHQLAADCALWSARAHNPVRLPLHTEPRRGRQRCTITPRNVAAIPLWVCFRPIRVPAGDFAADFPFAVPCRTNGKGAEQQAQRALVPQTHPRAHSFCAGQGIPQSPSPYAAPAASTLFRPPPHGQQHAPLTSAASTHAAAESHRTVIRPRSQVRRSGGAGCSGGSSPQSSGASFYRNVLAAGSGTQCCAANALAAAAALVGRGARRSVASS